MRHRLISSTQQDQLHAGVVQRAGDLHYVHRSLAPEQHQTGGQIGPQSEPDTLGTAVEIQGGVKPGVQNHTRNLQQAGLGETEGERLLGRPIRTANDVLVLSLDPEVWRVIGNIGEDRDQRRARPGALQRLLESAVVMGNQRHDHVRPVAFPVLLEQAYLLLVQQADQHVHHGNQLCGAEGPVAPEHDVIEFMELYPGGLADDVDRVEQILNIQQTQVPGPLLPADDLGERRRCRSVPSTGVDKNEIDFVHHFADP